MQWARLRARAAPDGWRGVSPNKELRSTNRCALCNAFVPDAVTNHWCSQMTAGLVSYLGIDLEQAHSLSLPTMLALVDTKEREIG